MEPLSRGCLAHVGCRHGFSSRPRNSGSLGKRLEHPVLGYGVAREELREQIVADMATHYGWAIKQEDIVFLPGVERASTWR